MKFDPMKPAPGDENLHRAASWSTSQDERLTVFMAILGSCSHNC
jgi:hypothetical protein